MKGFRWDKKYLHWGVTGFCVLAAGILFFQLVSNLNAFLAFWRNVANILSPIAWGLVIAYLVYPLMKIYSRWLFMPLCTALFRVLRRGRNRGYGAKEAGKGPAAPKHALAGKGERTPEEKLSRGLSIFLALLTALILLAGLISLVAPQLYNSVESIVSNSREYIARTDAWLDQALARFPDEQRMMITDAFGDFSGGIVKWATNNLLPEMRSLVANITVNAVNVVRNVYDIIIGLIVSVYVLYGMETFAGICKKALYVVFPVDTAGKILQGLRFTNEVFMGFLSGKILDSILMGLLCFIGCTILQMPFALLVSVIVGVTNIIPYFGPFIGAIPSALIILIDSPLKMLMFLVFIVLLQQFDGNVIGPKILGSQIGIDGFWVLFSILLGSGLFGFFGMLLGVPVFVVLSNFVDRLAKRKLQRSNLYTDAKDYSDLAYYDEDGTPVHFERQAKKRKNAAEPAAAEPSADAAAEGAPGAAAATEAGAGSEPTA